MFHYFLTRIKGLIMENEQKPIAELDLRVPGIAAHRLDEISEMTPNDINKCMRKLPLIISQSFRAEYQSCPRKSLLAHIYNQQRIPKAPSAAFFGICIHRGMEFPARAIKEGNVLKDAGLYVEGFEYEFKKRFEIPTPFDMEGVWKQYNPEHGAKIMENCFDKYGEFMHKVEILEAESVLVVNLLNKEGPLQATNTEEMRWAFGLKIDFPYRYNGALSYLDWKSTGKYSKAEGIQDNWIEQQIESDQFHGYHYGFFRKFGEIPSGSIGAILVHTTQKELYCNSYPVNVSKPSLISWKKNMILDCEEIYSEYVKMMNGDRATFRTCRSNCFAWNRKCSYYEICQAFPFEHPTLEDISNQFPAFSMNTDYIQDYFEAWIMGNVVI